MDVGLLLDKYYTQVLYRQHKNELKFMKITALTTQLVNLPLDKPIRTAIHDMRSVGCVCLTIHTNEGLVGEAYAFALNAQRLSVFDEMIKGLAHLAANIPEANI